MTGSERLKRAQALIEEELGEFRAFANVPASELETMAARLARAVAPLLEAVDSGSDVQRAA